MCKPISIERLINRCPVIDCDDYEKYPPVSNSEFYEMERGALLARPFAYTSVYVRTEDVKEPFIDIYIWEEKKSFEFGYTRFVICDGMRLPEELEQKLLSYTQSSRLAGDFEQMEVMYYVLNEYYPEWHYCGYKPKEIDRAIEHVYFTSHRSGSKEILYKAGLDNLAHRLNDFDSYNAIGTTPTEILGYNMPIRLLRILNQDDFLNYSLDADTLNRCANVYSRYSGYIIDCYPTLGQWLYFEGLYDRRMAGKDDFNRSIYNELSDANDDYDYCKRIVDMYFEIVRQRKERGISLKRNFPDLFELECELIAIKNATDPELVKLSDERVKNDSYQYEYSDGNYSVVFPKTLMDIHWEANELKNCLDTFIVIHASRGATILFIRRTDNPDKSFVVIGVVGNRINQAYGACNNRPDKETLEFLSQYARIRGFLFDPESACRLAGGNN